MTTKERNRALKFGGFEEMFDEGDRRRGSVFLTAVRSALLLGLTLAKLAHGAKYCPSQDQLRAHPLLSEADFNGQHHWICALSEMWQKSTGYNGHYQKRVG